MEMKRIIRMMLDYVPTEHLRDVRAKLFSSDGGPGSGNFGHAGRPGKVGGSMPGGGRQYRGGRADIGYFSSKKDWLNGLSGEKQQEAIGVLKQAKESMAKKLKEKKEIEEAWEKGHITSTERDRKIKDGRMEHLREDMTPEEFIVNCGEEIDMHNFLVLAQNARSWVELKEKIVKNNLSEDEAKVMNWIFDNVQNFNEFPQSLSETYDKLKAKALGFPVHGELIPEDVALITGVKKLPGKFDWYKKASERETNTRSMERCMYQAVEEHVPNTMELWGMSKEQFAILTQNFADTLKYKLLDKDSRTDARLAVAKMKEASGFDREKKYNDQLTPEEIETIERARQLFKPSRPRQEEITGEYLANIHDFMCWSNFRTKEEKKVCQDFLLLELKLMTGVTPKDENESETFKKEEERKEREKKEKQEVKRLAEERRKRDEELRKDYKRRVEEGVKAGNPMASYDKDTSTLGRDHMDEVLKGVNPYRNRSKELGDKKYTHNCQRCVMAFVARLRGYKVEAKPYVGYRGHEDPIFSGTGLKGMFKDCKEEHVEGRTGSDQRQKIESDLSDWGDGAVGLVSVKWKGRRSAHIFVVMNDHGTIRWYEPQNPKADAGTYVKTGEIDPWYTKMMRVDDKQFTERIHEAIRPEGGQYGDHWTWIV